MIDLLRRHLPLAQLDRVRDRVPVGDAPYAVLTLHRPSNVDRPDTLREILQAVRHVAARMPVVVPVHPRTRARLGEFGLATELDGALVTDPLGYIGFLALTSHASLILSDSGGLQEESTTLGIPCLTLRENTERPITVTNGTNRVVGDRAADIISGANAALATTSAPQRLPELWYGRAAERVAAVLARSLETAAKA